ncbi:glutathione S-transferase [bacterium]|nr:MAG: glutathione S-transferase [bacterium]
MYTLHCFGQSGNAFKVAFLLNALEVPWRAQHVDFFTGIAREPGWREQMNEMGEIPILDTGERRLTQSGLILTWLAERHGRFRGRTEEDRLDVLRWLLFDNHKFTNYFAVYRFMKSFSPTPPDANVLDFLAGRITNAFGIVDRHLATRRFIVGDEPTIADFSMCGYLFYPAEESAGLVANRYPAIDAWVARMREVPGWADPYALMPGPRIAPRW